MISYLLITDKKYIFVINNEFKLNNTGGIIFSININKYTKCAIQLSRASAFVRGGFSSRIYKK